MNIYSSKGISEILSKGGCSLSKARGQNYLKDKKLAYSIVSKVSSYFNDSHKVGCIEVGSGLGSLTLPLSKNFGFIMSVEIDVGISGCLKSVLDFYRVNNVKLLVSDFLKLSPENIKKEFHLYENVIFVSNLPYNAGGEILKKVIHEYDFITDCFVMVQKEFYERLLAKPLSSSYSALSVIFQLSTEHTELLFKIPRNLFFPIPSVDSVFIYFSKKKTIPNTKTFEYVKLLFSHRRKNILNAFNLVYDIKKEKVLEILSQCKIDPNLRIEALSPQEISKLTGIFETYSTH